MEMNGQEFYLSKLRANIPKIEAQINKMPVTQESLSNFFKFSSCCDLNRKIDLIIWNGWTTNAALRSEIAKFNSNTHRFFGNKVDVVFLIIWVVTLFNTMAVEAKTVFKTQRGMYSRSALQ